MSLNVYNAAKHHIGLGASGGTKYGFMLVGAYAKEMQREALGAQDFGGSTDLIGQIPSLARWTQDDFTGGAYQEDWSQDVAMFSSCRGFISEAQSRALINVPPLARVFAKDPHAEARPDNPALPLDMIRVGATVYVLFSNGIFHYNLSTGSNGWHNAEDTLLGIGGLAVKYDYVAIRYDPNEQRLYVLATGNLTNADPTIVSPVIIRFKTDLSAPTYNAMWDAPDGHAGDAVTGFSIAEGGIVLAIGTKLYLGEVPLKPNSVNAPVKWTRVDRLPGRWKDSCSYAGRTYILCGDSHKTTALVAFDGSSIEPIAAFPWNFDGTCITEYAGRLYIGGHGTDINGGPNSAELYEVTGASVRLVRSFAPLVPKQAYTIPTRINSLIVDEGLLWMNCKGLGLIAYDITTDALFGASDYQQGSDFDIYAMLGGYGRLWAWGHSDASYATKDGLYRIAATGDSISTYTSQLITSDFVFEPAVQKRLSELRVLTRYKGCAASISTDGGTTWTSLTAVASVDGFLHNTSFDLSGIDPARHWRFKIDVAMGTDPDAVGELVAYTCAFAFLDTGKRAWAVSINGSEAIEGRDVTTVDQDVSLTATTLWGWAMNKTRLSFTDVDGSTANVHLTGFRESQPIIGPNISGAGRPEAFYACTLLEV